MSQSSPNSSEQTDTSGSSGRGVPSASLIKALKRLLKPLVRLLLSHGITLPYLTQLLKELYIEVAEKEFALEDKKQTDSRISLLTGIHRKDTRRLRSELSEGEPSIPENISISSQIIARWISQRGYVDRQGMPKPLAKKKPTTKKKPPDFETLVKSISKQDIRPRVVLDEWLNLGIVHINEQDQVVLNTQAFIPENSFDDKAYYFGQNLHDHIAAGSHNLLGNKPAFFDRSVYYNCLSADSIQQLNDMSRELGMDVLKQINAKAMQLQEQDQELETDLARINLGIFFYSEADDEDCQVTHGFESIDAAINSEEEDLEPETSGSELDDTETELQKTVSEADENAAELAEMENLSVIKDEQNEESEAQKAHISATSHANHSSEPNHTDPIGSDSNQAESS